MADRSAVELRWQRITPPNPVYHTSRESSAAVLFRGRTSSILRDLGDVGSGNEATVESDDFCNSLFPAAAPLVVPCPLPFPRTRFSSDTILLSVRIKIICVR